MEIAQQEFLKENKPAPGLSKDVPYDERLSAWEISQLWLIYQANSLMKCILQYFSAQAQDPEIKTILTDALNMIYPKLSAIISLFNSVGFPIPYGYTDEDVNTNAKRLFSDSLMLSAFRAVTRFRLVKLAHALPLATRPDVRAFFNSALVEEQNLLNKAEDLLTKKGINVRPPYIPIPDRVNYIADNSWYGNLFGSERPINALELTHVFQRLETKLVESAIHLGFTQVVKDPKIKAYFSKGLQIFDNEIKRWSAILNKEDIILPLSWRSEVTDSLESPFSDKLMLFQSLLNITYSFYANGFAIANCNRTDLVRAFVKVEIDLGTYGKDGLDLMIANAWMEEIPLSVDRKGLKH
jgi:hypothetical protein